MLGTSNSLLLMSQTAHPPRHTAWVFAKEAVKKFRVLGSFFPSSRFLSERMIRSMPKRENICVAELGAGTGAITKRIISRLPKNSRLLVFEINPILANYLRKTVHDPRVTVVEEDAANLRHILKRLNINSVDCVISGLPLGNFSRFECARIFQAINESLGVNGVYVQFQYFLASWPHIRKSFRAKIVGYEIRNFPPAFLYRCIKR